MATQDQETIQLRARLAAEREEVVKEIAALEGDLETKGDYGLGEGDPMVYQWEFNRALRERAQQHLAEIDEAIAQLDQGAYGRCEKCGRIIEPDRLAVLPHTTLCSECAQRRR